MARALEVIESGPRLVALGADLPRRELRVATVFQLALAALLIGNLGRIPVFSTGEREVPVLLSDFGVAAVLLVGGLAMASHRVLRLDWVACLALLFALIGASSAALAIPRFDLSAFAVFVSVGYLARWLFYFGIYVVAINTLTARDAERVWGGIEAAVLVFTAFGVLQSAFLPDFAQRVYPGSRPYLDWDIQGHRLVSTFLDPNFAGAFINIALLVCLARAATGTRVAPWKLALLATGLVLTASRSSLLAVMVGGVVILFAVGISKRLMRIIGVAAVLLLLALPKLLQFAASFNKLTVTDASALARLRTWLFGLRALRDHWLIGIGFNTWGYVGERYGWARSFSATFGLEGGLLFIAVMTGVIGLVIYIAMLVAVVRRARQVWRDPAMPPNARGLAIGAAATVPMILAHSLFTNSLMLPFLMEPLWLLWAFPFVLTHDG